jgi:hypothetical protein
VTRRRSVGAPSGRAHRPLRPCADTVKHAGASRAVESRPAPAHGPPPTVLQTRERMSDTQ